MPATFWSFIAGALDYLVEKKAVSGRQYAALSEAGKRAVIGSKTLKTAKEAAKLKQLLVDAIKDGEDEAQFRQRIKDKIDLKRSDANRILRTGTKQAYLNGMTATMEKPHIAEAFPYVLYVSTHDGRTRPHHREMDGKIARLGTAEYDHFVELQNEWQCRCSLIPLSAKQARDRGISDSEDPN